MPNTPNNNAEPRPRVRRRKPLTDAQKQAALEACRRMYQRRAEQGVCRPCGKPLTGPGSTAFLCRACLKRLGREYKRRADRKRKAEGRIYHGPNVAIGTVLRATVVVDRFLLPPLDVLKADFRAKNPGMPLRTNTLIRETIRARFADPLVRVGPRLCDGIRMRGVQFNLNLDAETLAIVTRHARQTFDNNRAKTIRALIEAAARDIILRNPAAYPNHPLCRVTRGTTKKPSGLR